MIDAEELHDWLIYREHDVRDFGFRVYEGRDVNFLHRPQDDDDRKCAQVSLRAPPCCEKCHDIV